MEVDVAYLAGFFDGEGNVFFGYKGTNRGLKVSISQIDRGPIELFQTYFGGNIGIQKSRPGYRDLYRLQYHGERAKDVLANLYPYLRVKREAAAFGLENF